MSTNLITGYDITLDECGECTDRSSSVNTTPICTYLAKYNQNIYYDVRTPN